MTFAGLEPPQPLDLVSAAEVEEILQRTHRELSALEEQAAHAEAEADHAEQEARDGGADGSTTPWALVRLEGFLDDLRSEVARDVTSMLEVAERQARTLLDRARARASSPSPVGPIAWAAPAAPTTVVTPPSPWAAPASTLPPLAPVATVTAPPADQPLVTEPAAGLPPITVEPVTVETVPVVPEAAVAPSASAPPTIAPEPTVAPAPAPAASATPDPLDQPADEHYFDSIGYDEILADHIATGVVEPTESPRPRRKLRALPLSAVLEAVAVVLIMVFILLRLG